MLQRHFRESREINKRIKKNKRAIKQRKLEEWELEEWDLKRKLKEKILTNKKKTCNCCSTTLNKNDIVEMLCGFCFSNI